MLVQVRLATSTTSEDYVSGKLWCSATLSGCPWHPNGGCGFARHGTYGRVKPANTQIARWYCPQARRTVSALPDCLASHRSGTLDQCEALVCAAESAPSMQAACRQLRTDIELPGALRYVTRLVRDIHLSLKAIKGLFPGRFIGAPTLHDFALQMPTPHVLMQLREIAGRYLPQLPTPLGFNPPPIAARHSVALSQQRMGHDPPLALIKDSTQAAIVL